MYKRQTGCWLWGGRHDNKGYGRLSHGGTFQVAHRLSYFIHNGDFNHKKHVLHKCDVSACVNPDHLYLGDQTQNNIDRDTRGRQKTKHGQDHKVSKLKNEDVIAIRQHSIERGSGTMLAKKYNVSPSLIYLVRRKKAWAHI